MIYEYNLTDHLGNTRITFGDSDADGDAEILQENHYYPFGMAMTMSSSPSAAPPNDYLYNGKELQTELGLDWYDYGARMYDASIGRWNGVDRQSTRYLALSPFIYVSNNPLVFIDPNGEVIVGDTKQVEKVEKRVDRKIKGQQKKLSRLEKKGIFEGEKADEIQANISEYRTTKNEIEDLRNSDVVYEIRTMASESMVPGIRRSGNLSFESDPQNKTRYGGNIIVRTNGEIGVTAEELKHAHQFESSQLILDPSGGGALTLELDGDSYVPGSFGMQHEVEAGKRRSFIESGSLSSSSGGTREGYAHLPNTPITTLSQQDKARLNLANKQAVEAGKKILYIFKGMEKY